VRDIISALDWFSFYGLDFKLNKSYKFIDKYVLI
jgi:hypothetical protein